MYLLASEDRSGMFNHLGTGANTWANLTPDVLTKAVRLIVLAIGEQGVVQRSQIEVSNTKSILLNHCYNITLGRVSAPQL